MTIPPGFTETSPGVLERDDQAPNDTPEITAHYKDNASRILRADLPHYRAFADLVQKEAPTLIGCYPHAVAVGGGHPKLESSLRCRSARVVDGLAAQYRSQHAEFSALYGLDDVRYVTKRLLPPPKRIGKPGDLVTFVHLLEHLPWTATPALLAAARGDVLIYGPAIEAWQGDPNWIHIKPADHNTFATLDALRQAVRSAGFSVQWSRRWRDDLVIWATRED